MIDLDLHRWRLYGLEQTLCETTGFVYPLIPKETIDSDHQRQQNGKEPNPQETKHRHT